MSTSMLPDGWVARQMASGPCTFLDQNVDDMSTEELRAIVRFLTRENLHHWEEIMKTLDFLRDFNKKIGTQ